MVTPPLSATLLFRGVIPLLRPSLFPHAAPALPLDTHGLQVQPHRARISPWPVYNAAVARPIQRKELQSSPAAMKALANEAEKLKSRGTWDLSSVREWSDVSRDAKSNNQKVHVGRIFPIVVEKNSELPQGHPERKFKGRIVFGGDQVKDEHNQTAIFQELSTSPASLEASNMLDAYSLLPGNEGQQYDGHMPLRRLT